LRQSAIRRHLRNPAPKLQLCAGSNVLNGWLNADLYSPRQLSRNDDAIYMNLTKPWPIPDNSVRFILSEHGFEHFYYHECQHILFECNRTLAPGGRLRIITPDLGVYVGLFDPSPRPEKQRYITDVLSHYLPDDVEGANPAMVFNNNAYNFGHRFLWDDRTMRDLLSRSGFGNITRYPANQTDTPEFQDKEGRKSAWNSYESMAYEAAKTTHITNPIIRRWIVES
jgi:Methyltransferase domain